jgi:hypothetical protein
MESASTHIYLAEDVNHLPDSIFSWSPKLTPRQAKWKKAAQLNSRGPIYSYDFPGNLGIGDNKSQFVRS